MNVTGWYLSLFFLGLLSLFGWFLKWKSPNEDNKLSRWIFTIGFFFILLIPLLFKDNPIWLWLGIRFK